jgi:hypothetical protein
MQPRLDEHWPLIRNLVVEVHDMQGRLERMCEELRSRGFLVRPNRITCVGTPAFGQCR